MKNFIIIVFALFTVLTLTECDPDPEPDPIIPEVKTFQQNVTLDAQGTRQTITFINLKSKIDDVENSNSDWLTVLISPYTSGSPSVVVSATENTSTQQRSGNVTITAVSGDKVILTVTQQGAEEQKTDIGDPYDVPTDKSAYSRQR